MAAQGDKSEQRLHRANQKRKEKVHDGLQMMAPVQNIFHCKV